MRKQLPKLFGILAAAACIFGLVLVVPMLSPMPNASAQVLPNGYDVNCAKGGEGTVVCTVAGCPRVDLEDDLAGDILHTHINNNAEAGKESGKGCNAVFTETVTATGPFTYHVQGCRKRGIPDQDACGAYSVYQYTPPPATPVNCPAGSKSPTVVPPALCEAAPVVNVKCPEGSPTPDAVSLGACLPAPPKVCPPGSAAPEVPFGGQCTGPTNAVSMNITREGINANVAVTNNSALPAECAYTATKVQGLGPASLSRNVSVGPNSTGNITDLLFPPLFTSYSAKVTCTASYDGKQVPIGEATATVSG